MNLDELFRTAVSELKKRGCRFAVAGGYAASLFRSELRATADVDLLIYAEAGSEPVARQILRDLGFECRAVKLHQLQRLPMMHKRLEPNLLLCGTIKEEPDAPHLDFILPEMPWFQKALHRAEQQLVDYGFGPLPALTVEDVIIAKTFAGRLKDQDDLLSIFENNLALDLDYLSCEFERLKLLLPRSIKSSAPKALRLIKTRPE